MNELTHRRVHHASPELVFDCMTTPGHLTHFWGPVGTSTPEDRIVVDLRPGGAFVTIMVSDADGSEHEMRATYLEVDRPGRLAWIEPASGMTTAVSFVDLGDGRTEVVTHQTHVPDAYLGPEARTGFESSLDKADRYLDRQAQVAVELLRLADGLEAADGWDAPSLCEGWRVREVVAHLTMPARYDEAAFLAELEADGYDFTALSNRIAARDAAAMSTAALLADLRDPVLHRWQPPGGGAAGALNHAVVHSLDVTVPLGLARPDPDVAVRLVLGDLLAGGAAPFGVDPATVDADGPDVTRVLGLTGRRSL